MDDYLQASKKSKLSNSFGWISHSFEAPANSDHRQRKQSTVRNRKRRVVHAEKPSDTFAPESWAERFKPHSKEELAVHKKKVFDVEEWLKNSMPGNTARQQNPLLLLTGPAGAGKTTTVKVLTRDLNIDVSEWSSHLYENASYSSYTGQNFQQNSWTNKISESQAAIFSNFLLRAGKYPSLFCEVPKKLILIEEFPNVFLKDPTQFHSIIRTFCKGTRCPAVFIISDCSFGDSLENQLFPKHLQSELKITNISFNPVAPTMLMKVLNRISTIDIKGGTPSKSVLEAIVSDCNGDIRNAINLLQFQSAVGRPNKIIVPTKAKKRGKNDRTTDVQIGAKDSSLFLFHALGKVLYCKRDTTKGSDEKELPSHLCHRSRFPLLSNPEEIFERTAISADGFSLFLHENYPSFVEDSEVAYLCADAFSFADTLSTEWTARDIMSGYSASLVSRSLMFNLKPISSGGRWRPLKKPQYYSTIKNFRNSNSLLKNSFKESRLTMKELQTEFVPYLFKLGARPKNEDQRRAIAEVGRMNVQNPSRQNFDSLSEKDVVNDETMDVGEPSTSASIDAETTDAAYVGAESDEDYVIEDYDDD